MKKKIFLFLTLIILCATFLFNNNIIDFSKTSKIDSNVIKETNEILTESNDKDIEIFFCPSKECANELYEFILSAEKSAHCAFFDLDLENIIEILEEKNEEGKDIRIVVDNENKEEVSHLNFSRIDTTSQYSHNKFCIVDGDRISTGSFNPTTRGSYYNNNNLVIIESELMANSFEEEFEELWDGKFGEGNLIKNPTIDYNGKAISAYFCPEDHCGDMIYNELMKAEDSINFMTFSFTHSLVANALLLKNSEGVKIKGLFEKSQKSQYSKHDLLEFQNISVKWDQNKYNMHHKVFIIDEEIVITGSFNPSNNADKNNDENIMILRDENIAKKYMTEFEKLWNYEFFKDEEKNAQNIVIDEVMYDPEGKDSGKEYIFLKNIGDKEIDLSYWRLSNNKSTEVLQGIIKPNSFFRIEPKFSLVNKNGILILSNLANEQVDFVAWEGYWNLEEIGKALQRTKYDKVNSLEQWK